MRRRRFRIFYFCFLGVCILLSSLALLYVFVQLRQFERTQPEYLLQAAVHQMQRACDTDTLESILTLPAELQGSFKQGNAIFTEYQELLAREDLSFAHKAGTATQAQTDYIIRAGDVPVATVHMRVTAQDTKLGFLPITEYEITSVEPAYTAYHMTLPASLTLRVNDEKQKGRETENGIVYNVVFFDRPTITIEDMYRNVIQYEEGMEVSVEDYIITVPENYKVRLGEVDLLQENATFADNPEYKYVAQYCEDLPKNCTWKVSVLAQSLKLVVTDNLGNTYEPGFTDGAYICTSQAGATSVPAEISSQIDPLTVAQTVAKYLTQDLGTKAQSYGYFTIKKYLINDSYLDDKYWKWATNIDVAFTSIHTLCNPPFLDEKVSNYVRYSDTCFSCDVSFFYHFKTSISEVKDFHNDTYYFAYTVDPTKSQKPAWYLVECVSRTEEANQESQMQQGGDA